MRISNRKEKKRNNRMRIFKKVFFALIMIAPLIAIGVYFRSMLNTVEVDEDIGINEIKKVTVKGRPDNANKDIIEDTDYKDGITNILIMGIDEGDYRNARSDVMMISTIDTKYKKVKLTSLMRDSLVYIPTSQTYQKLNHSYMEGGPNETLRAVNTNLDLSIENFVIFNFKAVEEAIDYLGGYPAFIDNGESTDMQLEEGPHHLTGNQAIWYMRIRKNSGGDQGRNQRQRDLIMYILNETEKMSKLELMDFTRKILPLIKTSYSFSDIKEWVDIYMVVREGLDIEQYSFPSEYYGGKLNDGLWYAVANTFEGNVIQLHQDIFGDSNYIPNDKVNEINDEISRISKVY